MNDTNKQTSEQPNENPKRVQLAHQAATLITGQRQADYGPPIVNFQRIANLWNAHMETDIFTPRKVAELMFLLKVARTVTTPTEDSYVDAIGYAAIAGEFADLELQKPLPTDKKDLILLNKELYDGVISGDIGWDEFRQRLGYTELAKDPEVIQKSVDRQTWDTDQETWREYSKRTGGDGK